LVQSSDSKLNLKKPSTHQTEPEAVHPVFASGAVFPNLSHFELAEHTHLFHDHRITIHNAECGSMYLNLELQIVPSFAPWIIVKIVVKPAIRKGVRQTLAVCHTVSHQWIHGLCQHHIHIIMISLGGSIHLSKILAT
jgi:hypothetical protein